MEFVGEVSEDRTLAIAPENVRATDPRENTVTLDLYFEGEEAASLVGKRVADTVSVASMVLVSIEPEALWVHSGKGSVSAQARVNIRTEMEWSSVVVRFDLLHGRAVGELMLISPMD